MTRTTDLELPDEIDLRFELANVGSRTLATLADLGLCALALLTVYLVASLLDLNASDGLTRFGSNALTIALVVLVFTVQWLYFFLFEWRWNGQTPGKRLLHLRVIKVDGAPVSSVDELLRNLARPLDATGVGLLLIFLTPRAQRLGDVMARTIVIHETPIDWSIFDQSGEETAAFAPSIRLTPVQWELLHRFLNRRAGLPAEVRARVAASIYTSLKPLAAGTDLERSPLDPEPWLTELARRT